MASAQEEREYYIGLEWTEGGGVQVFLHVTPAFEEGMDSQSVGHRYFLPRHVSGWTDEQTVKAALEWAHERLTERGVAIKKKDIGVIL